MKNLTEFQQTFIRFFKDYGQNLNKKGEVVQVPTNRVRVKSQDGFRVVLDLVMADTNELCIDRDFFGKWCREFELDRKEMESEIKEVLDIDEIALMWTE
jgi:hypothetical protein